jgi:hypothetical protein
MRAYSRHGINCHSFVSLAVHGSEWSASVSDTAALADATKKRNGTAPLNNRRIFSRVSTKDAAYHFNGNLIFNGRNKLMKENTFPTFRRTRSNEKQNSSYF